MEGRVAERICRLDRKPEGNMDTFQTVGEGLGTWEVHVVEASEWKEAKHAVYSVEFPSFYNVHYSVATLGRAPTHSRCTSAKTTDHCQLKLLVGM